MKKGMEESKLEDRLRRKMSGLYENEAMTADLDDESANEFLKWAATRVKSIVGGTAELDEEQAEEIMYPKMRALRKLSRYVNQLAKGTDDPSGTLQKILDQARELYGDAVNELDLETLTSLFYANQGQPKALLKALRKTFEGEDIDGEEEKNQFTR